VSIMELECDGCARARGFEQPPCAERHEPACPEWVCTGCGLALLVNPPLMRRAAAQRRSRVSRRPRRMAA
jgi:hypothetical protein